MKHTHKSLRTAYTQFVDLRVDVKRRAQVYFVDKGFTVLEDQLEEFLLDWNFRSVFRSLVEASLDNSFGAGKWRITSRGTGNRVMVRCLSPSVLNA